MENVVTFFSSDLTMQPPVIRTILFASEIIGRILCSIEKTLIFSGRILVESHLSGKENTRVLPVRASQLLWVLLRSRSFTTVSPLVKEYASITKFQVPPIEKNWSLKSFKKITLHLADLTSSCAQSESIEGPWKWPRISMGWTTTNCLIPSSKMSGDSGRSRSGFSACPSWPPWCRPATTCPRFTWHLLRNIAAAMGVRSPMTAAKSMTTRVKSSRVRHGTTARMFSKIRSSLNGTSFATTRASYLWWPVRTWPAWWSSTVWPVWHRIIGLEGARLCWSWPWFISPSHSWQRSPRPTKCSSLSGYLWAGRFTPFGQEYSWSRWRPSASRCGLWPAEFWTSDGTSGRWPWLYWRFSFETGTTCSYPSPASPSSFWSSTFSSPSPQDGTWRASTTTNPYKAWKTLPKLTDLISRKRSFTKSSRNWRNGTKNIRVRGRCSLKSTSSGTTQRS